MLQFHSTGLRKRRVFLGFCHLTFRKPTVESEGLHPTATLHTFAVASQSLAVLARMVLEEGALNWSKKEKTQNKLNTTHLN